MKLIKILLNIEIYFKKYVEDCKIQVRTEMKTFCEEFLSCIVFFHGTSVVFLHILISAD